MKRLLSVVLAVLMCVLPLATSVVAAEVPSTAKAVYTFSDAADFPGEQIEINISLETFAAFKAAGVAFITYDEDVLEYNDAKINGDFKDLMFMSDFNKTDKTLSAASISEIASYNGTVLTLYFTIKEDAEVGEYTITGTPSISNQSTMEAFAIPGTITVKGKDFTGLSFKDKTVTYDSEIHTLEVTGVPEFATVEYTVDGEEFNGTEDAGTYEVVATVTAPGYNKWKETATLTIEKKDLIVDVNVPSKVYDGTTTIENFTEYITAEGIIDGDNVHINYDEALLFYEAPDAGTWRVVGNLGLYGDGDLNNYNIIYKWQEATATITPKPITVKADDITVKVGAEMPELTYTPTGLVEGDTLRGITLSTKANTKTVKEYPITIKADKNYDRNYSITTEGGTFKVVDKSVQTVTVAPVENKTYGGDDFQLAVTAGNEVDSKVKYTSETPAIVSVNDEGWVYILGAGTAKITVSKAGDEEYADFSETVTFTVNKKPLTITAENKIVKKGNEMPELTYTVEGLVKGDELTGALTTTAKNTTTVKDYPITQGTLKASANYSVTFVPGTLSVIDKAVQDVFVEDIENVTYGDGTVELVVTFGENVTDSPVVYTAETNNVSVDGDGYVTILGAGTAKITVSKAGNEEYADFSETVTFTVNKKNVTVTADNKTATKGGTLPELTYKAEGLVNGDELSVTLTTTAKNTNTVKDYPITVKVAANANYNVTTVNGVLSVIDKTPQNITVTSNLPSNLIYGDEGFKIDVAYGETVTEAVTTFVSSNDDVVKVDAEGNVTVIGAGTAKITVSKAGNDTVADFVEEIQVVIAKREITVNAVDASKKIGADDPALTYTYTGTLVDGDEFTGNVAREAGERVGTYDITIGDLALNANYKIIFNGATFTIFDKTPQDIEVAGAYGKTYGDAPFVLEVTKTGANVSDADVTFTSDNEDVATVDADGNVTIVGAGTAKITVAKAGNEDLADFTKNVTVTVAKREIKVTADAKEKYVGQDTPELTFTYEGELVGDDAFTGELAVNDLNKAGGKYDIKIGTLTLGDNYKVTYVGAKLSVLAKLNQEIEIIAPEDVPYGMVALTWYVNKGVNSNKTGEVTVTSSNTAVATLTKDFTDSDTGSEHGTVVTHTVGKTVLSFKVEGNEMYNDWEDSVTLVVNKQSVTITIDNKTKKIGNDDPVLTYSIETLYSKTDDVESGTDGVTLVRKAGEKLGTYAIDAVVDMDKNLYDIKVNKGIFTIIDKLPATIVTEPEIETTYAFDFIEIEAEIAEIELPSDFSIRFKYSSDNEDVILIPDEQENAAVIVGAGTATVTVLYEGNSEYAASEAEVVITVLPKEVTIEDLDLVGKTAAVNGIIAEHEDVAELDFDKLNVIFVASTGEENDFDKYEVTNFVLKGEDADNYTVVTEMIVVPADEAEGIELVEVSAIAENGTVEGTGSYLAGSEVTLKATANKNYKFDGWYVGEEKISSDAEYTFTAEADIELTAMFKKSGGTVSVGGGSVSRTVYFKLDDETTNKVSVDKGDKVQKPEDLTREGFTFGGWFTDAECTEEYDFDKSVEMSITLYAKWTAVETPDDGEDKPDDGEDKPEEWENPYVDVDENDWYYDVVKTATAAGIMNGVSEDTFAPDMFVTRAMIVTMLYRAEGSPAAINEVSFEDLEEDAYYLDAVEWAAENGIVFGYSETEFAPNNNVTREQIAAILFRYAAFKGIEAIELSENLFFDDADEISAYAVAPMNWLVGKEIITGYEDGTVRPQGNATRAEVAAMTARILAFFAQ